MNSLDSFLNEQLAQREAKGTLRKLRLPDPSLIDFASNDYLGLARILFDRGNRASGSTGSRLLSGNTAAAEALEKRLAKLFQSEATLLFNSGYSANLGVLSAIAGKNDTILYDELVHASIKDGVRLSLAKRYPFRHNDLNNLEEKLQRSTGKAFIVVESVYSMDGDRCPLQEIIALTRQYNAYIILDEAHSTGVFGENGSGLAVQQGLSHQVDIRIYTFGKALGAHGACVAGSSSLINFLVNYSRPFIYTTALPPEAIESISNAFSHLEKHPELQRELHRKIESFKTKLKVPTTDTPIQIVSMNSPLKVKSLAQSLQLEGFNTSAIVSPTVHEGKERIRICLHAFNSDDDISRLASVINQTIA